MPVLAADPDPDPVAAAPPQPDPAANPLLAAPVAAAVQPHLPLARQPFNKDWPVHNLGDMNIACSDCGALHWLSERLSSSSKIHPKFGTCCFSGKVHLPRLHDPPPELLDLLRGQDHISKDFRNNIRNYNNALAMTSLGCQQDQSVNSTGQGPYLFKVQGSIYHNTGPLIPAQGRAPNYAQLYIYDPQEALDYRMGHRANAGLHRQTMQILQDMLYRLHPGAQLYKQAFELTKNIPPNQFCRIALRYTNEQDRRRYNLPSANELAVILPGDGDQATTSRDIVLFKTGGGIRRINDLHPLYPSLHFVLLFPTGQLSWHPDIPYRDEEIPQQPEQQPVFNDQGDKRKMVTQSEYVKYHLHPHQNESNHIFMAGKLFQEYVVDCWATTEQYRLEWVQKNQTKIRADTYKGLTDALAVDLQMEANNLGQRIVLPSSFSGSSRLMIQNCQDALALNHQFRGADFFLTMTANPNWPEVKAALLPGQSPADRPDLINHVFHLKVKELLDDIYKQGVLGRAVAHVWTTEF